VVLVLANIVQHETTRRHYSHLDGMLVIIKHFILRFPDGSRIHVDSHWVGKENLEKNLYLRKKYTLERFLAESRKTKRYYPNQSQQTHINH